jgi:hypothetical protein
MLWGIIASLKIALGLKKGVAYCHAYTINNKSTFKEALL